MQNNIPLSQTSLRIALVAGWMFLGGASAVNAQASKDCIEKSGDAAIAACTEAIRLEPKNATNFYYRGYEYETKGDIDRALVDYGDAIRRDPKNSRPFYRRGTMHERKGDLDRALADYSEAIRLDPTNATRSHYNLGVLYERKGDKDRAIANFSRANGLGHKDAANELRRLGVSPPPISQKRLQQVIQWVLKSSDVRPVDERFSKALGLAHPFSRKNAVVVIDEERHGISVGVSDPTRLLFFRTTDEGTFVYSSTLQGNLLSAGTLKNNVVAPVPIELVRARFEAELRAWTGPGLTLPN